MCTLAVTVSERKGHGNMTMEIQQINDFSSDVHSITDGELRRAAEQAERRGSEMPLVLQELRYKIQLQRAKQGKAELKVEFEEPPKYELTEAEKRKQERRKLRNRQAAKNSRNRKKNLHMKLQEANKAHNHRKEELTRQVSKLRVLLSQLQKGVKSSRICDSSYSPRGRLALGDGHVLQGTLLRRPLLQSKLDNVQNIALSQAASQKHGWGQFSIFPEAGAKDSKSTRNMWSSKDFPFVVSSEDEDDIPLTDTPDIPVTLAPKVRSLQHCLLLNVEPSTEMSQVEETDDFSEMWPFLYHFSTEKYTPSPGESPDRMSPTTSALLPASPQSPSPITGTTKCFNRGP